MFEVKSNKEIGRFLGYLIDSKYMKRNDFCRDYLKLSHTKISSESVTESVKGMSNRLSQILRGQKSIQVYDLLYFSELLSVSCETILSAGSCNCETYARLTNYDVAGSKNKRLWNKYANANQETFLRCDEYGKTLLDYAFENENYKLLRYLYDNGYILFSEECYSHEPDEEILRNYYGLVNEFENTAVNYRTMMNSSYGHGCVGINQRWRNELISMAVENSDLPMLNEVLAREQRFMHNFYAGMVLDELSDEYRTSIERLVSVIADSVNESVLNYFSEEYEIMWKTGRRENSGIYTYVCIGEVADIMIKNNHKGLELVLKNILKHNKNTEKKIQNLIDEYAVREYSDYNNPEMYSDYISRCIHYSGNKRVVATNFSGCHNIASNIIQIKEESKDKYINLLIKKINEFYKKLSGLDSKIIINGKSYAVELIR